jgi:spore germination protein D
MQHVLFDTMKTPDYRKQMMSAVTEALQNPLNKLEIMKLLQSVVKEELTPKQTKKSGSGEGGGESSGGGSGGGGSGGGEST